MFQSLLSFPLQISPLPVSEQYSIIASSKAALAAAGFSFRKALKRNGFHRDANSANDKLQMRSPRPALPRNPAGNDEPQFAGGRVPRA